MNLQPLPPGKPGSDLGVAHMLKHWCSPHEMWEDIAHDIPAELRPGAPAERFDALSPTPLWEQASAPSPELREHWRMLIQAYEQGYFACVSALVSDLPDPPSRRFMPDPSRPGVLVTHAGEGVLLYTRRGMLYTAYRPVDFKLTSHACPPRDARSVSLRRKMAPVFARKKLARLLRAAPEYP